METVTSPSPPSTFAIMERCCNAVDRCIKYILSWDWICVFILYILFPPIVIAGAFAIPFVFSNLLFLWTTCDLQPQAMHAFFGGLGVHILHFGNYGFLIRFGHEKDIHYIWTHFCVASAILAASVFQILQQISQVDPGLFPTSVDTECRVANITSVAYTGILAAITAFYAVVFAVHLLCPACRE